MSKYIFSNQEYCQMETLSFQRMSEVVYISLGQRKEGRREGKERKKEGILIK